ncbi:MAG: hypothetical protein ACOYMF_05735 [Bacteroidales bacterium]
MILQLTEKETTMLKASITAKIKRCRNSIDNNVRNPWRDDIEAKIEIRKRQIIELNVLREKLEYVAKEETEKIFQ